MQREHGCGRTLILIIVGLIGLFIIARLCWWEGYLKGFLPRPLPLFPTLQPYTAWSTPPAATVFDYPLLSAEAYGPLPNTRYDVQNPAWGNHSNCFRDARGETIPFSQLYHAGVAKHAPVHAVADGMTVFVLNAGSEGQIVGVEHVLASGKAVYSVYWHVTQVQVEPGQPVSRGQAIAAVHDMGLNSHLHWEMRTFLDGSNMFPPGTAGARGTCNRQIAGVGYTWDDDPARAHPGYYGYLDPIPFVESHR